MRFDSGGKIMKKISILLVIAILLLSFVACANNEEEDLASIDNYMTSSKEEKLENGTVKFTEGPGETAIISDYIGIYTPHAEEIPTNLPKAKRTVIGIGDEAFYYCTALTEVIIPETVLYIGDWAFAGCTALETIVIPASVTSIGKGAFSGCTSLKTVIFEGNALTTLGDYAFIDCEVLSEIVLPEGLVSIGTEAFRDCVAITSLTTPSTLKTIGNMAFYNCEGLNAEGALTLSASIEEIGEFAFTGINKLYITAPADSYAAEYVSEMRDAEIE